MKAYNSLEVFFHLLRRLNGVVANLEKVENRGRLARVHQFKRHWLLVVVFV